MASTKVAEQSHPSVRMMSRMDAVKVAASGAVIGLIIAAMYALLSTYVFTPTLCNEANTAIGRCDNVPQFANTLTMVLGAFVGLFAMVQLRVFRPLLVVLLAMIGLWGVILLVSDLVWWQMGLWLAAIFGLGYVAFAWIVQVRQFVAAVVLGAVLAIVLRLVLMS